MGVELEEGIPSRHPTPLTTKKEGNSLLSHLLSVEVVGVTFSVAYFLCISVYYHSFLCK